MPQTFVHWSRSSVALGGGRWCRRCPARSPRAARRWCPPGRRSARGPPLRGGPVRWAVHAGVGRGQRLGAACGQPRGDGTAREDVGVGGEHVGRHAAAGRQTGDVDAAGIAAVLLDRLVGHLLDRQGLAPAAGAVTRLEPVEAGVGVVGGVRLRVDHREPVAVGQRGPARVGVVVARALRTAVQGQDQRRAGREGVGDVGVHGQVSGVGPEPGDLGEARRGRRRAGGEQPGGERQDAEGRGGQVAQTPGRASGALGGAAHRVRS